MIYSLTGTLTHVDRALAVVDCGGVGYACQTSMYTMSKLPERGARVTLFTYMHLRENALDFFGFLTPEELGAFKILISVSGVGPKVALAILSELSPDRFAISVASSDVKSLTRAPGVGQKLAQRIILELKDKITKDDLTDAFKGGSFDDVPVGGGNLSQAVQALTVLGYARADAAKAVSGKDPSLPVEELIKIGLKYLAGI